jgi:hypothetical protein
MNAQLSLWVEIPVAMLLVLSSLFALIGAIGLLRMKDYFPAHAPAGPGLDPGRVVRGAGLDHLLFGE